MTDKNNLTALRLQLSSNGYEVVPNIAKQCVLKGWPTVSQDEATIRDWTRKHSRFADTGIRLGNGVAVIDIDVEDRELVEEIAAQFEALIEEWGMDPLAIPVRGNTKNGKEAWFVRTTETFNRIHTHRWRRPGAGSDDPTAHVEIFGGGSARQFGAFGSHGYDDAGEVLSRYVWADEISPLTTPVDALPCFSKQQFFDLARAAERCLEEAGYELVTRSKSGEDLAEKVYDITEDMRFDCDDGVTRSLSELRDAAGAGDLRCSASFLEGPEARRRDRCLVRLERSGGVAIWETSAGVTHCEAPLKPRDPDQQAEDFAAKLAAAGIKAVERRERSEELEAAIGEEDDQQELYKLRVEKLVNEVAYCRSTPQRACIPLDARELTDGWPASTFREDYRNRCWHETVIGPRGGVQEKSHNPVDGWLGHRDRVSVAGVRFAPGEEYPLFDQSGLQWVNIYRPPAHEGEGEIATWLEFIEHLFPDAAEQAWFCQWLAYKAAHPEVPGPGLILFAKHFGTGRGTLFNILRAYFGQRYVTEIKQKTLMGRDYQSQYNDWQINNLIVTVDEAADDQDATSFKSRQLAYERLKEVHVPEEREVRIQVKGMNNFMAKTHASLIVATNHADAIPLDVDDRRFTVLTSGRKLSDAPGDLMGRIHAWRAQAGSMAALQEWFGTIDLAGYSPYEAPPLFEGKKVMARSNRSELDEAFDDVLETLPGKVFCDKQIIAAIRAMLPHSDLMMLPHRWEHAIRKMLQSDKRMSRVEAPGGGDGRMRIGGREDRKKYTIYAFNFDLESVAQLDRGGLVEEFLKNGNPAGGENRAPLKLVK